MMKLLMYLIMLNFVILFSSLKMMMFMLTNLTFLMSFMFIFMLNYDNFNWMLIYSWFGLDNYSMILVMLTLWILGTTFFLSYNFKDQKIYSLNLILLLISLLISFSSLNYFMFYLFFEISLIPTFLLIMGWGYQPERLSASMYMLLYTLFASLPLLILIFYFYDYFNTLNFLILLNSQINLGFNNFILYFYVIFAFLVKLPMFMFHLWLPKAHIEAPITGSVILAAIMLKLGGYGLIRSMMMMKNLVVEMNYILFSISLVGMIYLSLLSLRCNDMKLIVAYSSVVHMGMVLMGICTMSKIGFLGSFMMMVGHGFSSSALFVLVNYSYESFKSRNLMINKGIIYFLPSLSLWWFLFCVSNMSAPISLNWISEISILLVLLSWSSKIIIFLILGMYFSSIYSLYLFSYSQHGKFNYLINSMKIVEIKSFLLMLIYWIPLNLLILKMEIFF